MDGSSLHLCVAFLFCYYLTEMFILLNKAGSLFFKLCMFSFISITAMDLERGTLNLELLTALPRKVVEYNMKILFYFSDGF